MPAIGQVPIAPAVAAPIPVGAISVSSLAALTLSQQETIERGTVVVTPTQTYVYIGVGGKTSSASYIDLIGAGVSTDTEVSTSINQALGMGISTHNLQTTSVHGITNTANLSLVGHTHAVSDVTNLQTALNGKQASGDYVLTTDARLGSQTIFTLGGEAKTVFFNNASYLYGCMPTRGAQMTGSYTNAVLKILGNFTVTGISINQYLPSATGTTLTYQLVRVLDASTTQALGPSITVNGNNNLTTSISSISASLNSGDHIGLMLTLGASGTVPVATAATTILANIYCVPR